MAAVSMVVIDIGSETLGPLDMEACCQAQWLIPCSVIATCLCGQQATSNKHACSNLRMRSLIRPVAKQMKNCPTFVPENEMRCFTVSETVALLTRLHKAKYMASNDRRKQFSNHYYYYYYENCECLLLN
jgi:hypothetical protein